MDEHTLELEYLKTALKRSQLLKADDVTGANRQFDKLQRLLKEGLDLLPDRGEAVLKRIIQNDDPEIQINAAAALLPLDEPFAISLLQRIAAGRGLSAFTAEMTLKEWKKKRART